MNPKVKDICTVLRFATEVKITLPKGILISPNFKEQQKAFENIKNNAELEVQESETEEYTIIHIKERQ